MNLEELKRMLAEATKGPWRIVQLGNEEYSFPLSIITDNGGFYITRDGTTGSANAALIVAAVNALPELIAIATEERERIARWMIEHSFATGHGDTIDALLDELSWQIKEREIKTLTIMNERDAAYAAGRADQREADAEIARKVAAEAINSAPLAVGEASAKWFSGCASGAESIAKAIEEQG